MPHYRDVTLVNGAVLTTSKFDDNNKGGVVMFFVSGTLSICSTCRIDVSEKGWSGKWVCDVSVTWPFCGRGLIPIPPTLPAHRWRRSIWYQWLWRSVPEQPRQRSGCWRWRHGR